jgi:thiol-disulfide isomerase/thioredoxin
MRYIVFLACLGVLSSAAIFATQDAERDCSKCKSCCSAKSKSCCEDTARKHCGGCGEVKEKRCGGSGCGEVKAGCGSTCAGEVSSGCGKSPCSEAKAACGSSCKGEAKSGCGGCGEEHETAWEKGDGLGKIEWVSSHDRAIQLGREQNKPVLLHFYANWCAPCRLMNRTTFSDSKVAAFENANFISVQFNIDECTELVTRYKIDIIPTVLVVTPTGETLSRHIELQPTAYLQRLQAVSQAYGQWTVLQAKIAENPKDVSLFLQLGGLLDSLGATASAANAYDKAADLLMGEKDLSEQRRREVAAMLIRVGDACVDGQDHPDAARIDRTAERLEAVGFADNALYLRAIAMGARHEGDKMIETLAALRSKYPESAKTEAAIIWTAWAQLILQENKQGCLDTLKGFSEKYPQSVYADYAKQLSRRATHKID